MTATEYLERILRREMVDTGASSPVKACALTVYPTLQKWGGIWLAGVKPSGSFAKGTANKSGTDIDLFISVKSDTPNTLAQIYDTLFSALKEGGYNPRKQNVSIGINIHGYSIDLVPAKLQNDTSGDHSLYKNKQVSWTKTNIDNQIQAVAYSGVRDVIRIVKLWRNQKGLDFPSFYLELTVIAALKDSGNQSLDSKVLTVFQYLRDSFITARVIDPSNTNNIISDDLTVSEKVAIKIAAINALAATNWEQIVT